MKYLFMVVVFSVALFSGQTLAMGKNKNYTMNSISKTLTKKISKSDKSKKKQHEILKKNQKKHTTKNIW